MQYRSSNKPGVPPNEWCDPEWHAKIKVNYERLLRTLWYVTRKFDMVRFWERSSPPTGVTAGAPLIILEKFARVRWGRRKRRRLENGKNGTDGQWSLRVRFTWRERWIQMRVVNGTLRGKRRVRWEHSCTSLFCTFVVKREIHTFKLEIKQLGVRRTRNPA